MNDTHICMLQLSGEWDFDEEARTVTLTVWQGAPEDGDEEGGYSSAEEEDEGASGGLSKGRGGELLQLPEAQHTPPHKPTSAPLRRGLRGGGVRQARVAAGHAPPGPVLHGRPQGR